jgi:MFS family permease
VTLGLMALVYAVGESHAIPVQHSATLLAIAVVLLVAFLVIERRTAFPLMPFRIFRLGTVRAANMLAATFFAAVYGLMFVGALYLQGVLGYSPFKAGLAFVPMAIAIAIVSNLGGRLVTRLGLRPALLLGLVLLASGIAFISRIDVGVGYAAVLLPGSITVGIAIGLIFPAVMISAVAGVPETDRGLASSLVTTSQQTGGAIGTAITAAVIAVFNERFAAATGALPTAPESLIAGFQPGLIAAATIAALGIIVAATSLRERQQDSEADAAGAKIAAPAVGPDTVARSSSDHRP